MAAEPWSAAFVFEAHADRFVQVSKQKIQYLNSLLYIFSANARINAARRITRRVVCALLSCMIIGLCSCKQSSAQRDQVDLAFEVSILLVIKLNTRNRRYRMEQDFKATYQQFCFVHKLNELANDVVQFLSFCKNLY